MKGLLIDLDGVVFTGGDPIHGAADFLAEAHRRNFPFLLATNNSTATAETVAERLRGMGMPVDPGDILTSSQAAAAYIRENAMQTGGKRVMVVGEAGIRDAVLGEGLELVNGTGDADWVVAGLDRSFDYVTLTAATRAILGGARFVATNTDALLPMEGGSVLPGAGSIVGSIRAATGVDPVITGKPEPAMFQQGVARLGVSSPAEVAMVGDRLDTDIVGAQNAGLRAILVLTGVSTADQAKALATPPDAILSDLHAVGGLLGWW